jgi:DNA-binding IclR family transcriptional regulator
VLQTRGYIKQDPETRRYRPTAHLVGVARAILRNIDLRAAAESPCDELVGATGESVHAAQPTSDGIVYVLQRRGGHRVSVNTDVGARAPMHATASGKAVLAFLPEDRVRASVQEPLHQYTSRTHSTFDDLASDLEMVRRRGYAVDDEELTYDVRCVAAPVFDINGDVYGSIRVSGPNPAHRGQPGVHDGYPGGGGVGSGHPRLAGPLEPFGQAGEMSGPTAPATRELERPAN